MLVTVPTAGDEAVTKVMSSSPAELAFRWVGDRDRRQWVLTVVSSAGCACQEEQTGWSGAGSGGGAVPGGVLEKPVVQMPASMEKARERAQPMQTTRSGWRTGSL